MGADNPGGQQLPHFSESGFAHSGVHSFTRQRGSKVPLEARPRLSPQHWGPTGEWHPTLTQGPHRTPPLHTPPSPFLPFLPSATPFFMITPKSTTLTVPVFPSLLPLLGDQTKPQHPSPVVHPGARMTGDSNLSEKKKKKKKWLSA